MGGEVGGGLQVVADVGLEEEVETETAAVLGQGAEQEWRAGGGIAGSGGEVAAGEVAGGGESEGAVARAIRVERGVAEVTLGLAVTGWVRGGVPIKVNQVGAVGRAVEGALDKNGSRVGGSG